MYVRVSECPCDICKLTTRKKNQIPRHTKRSPKQKKTESKKKNMHTCSRSQPQISPPRKHSPSQPNPLNIPTINLKFSKRLSLRASSHLIRSSQVRARTLSSSLTFGLRLRLDFSEGCLDLFEAAFRRQRGDPGIVDLSKSTWVSIARTDR